MSADAPFWDALYAQQTSLEKITPDEPVSERRLIFLVTDGDQKGSSLKPDLVLKRLKELDATLYGQVGRTQVDLKTVGGSQTTPAAESSFP